MPPRQRFYDPFIQDPAATVSDMSQPVPEPVHGFTVTKQGMFLHLDDVVATLRTWAATPGYEILGEAADMFSDMVSHQQADAPSVEQPPPDHHPEVARIEVYPDPDGKWHARPVASDGSILYVTDGSFDRAFVEQDANERWPGKQLFELGDAMGDSIWDEEDHSFGFNGRRRPSPRRLWS